MSFGHDKFIKINVSVSGFRSLVRRIADRLGSRFAVMVPFWAQEYSDWEWGAFSA